MVRRARRVWVIAVSITTAACSGDAASQVPEGPADAEAEIRPDLMTVEPQQVAPGSTVAVTFPEETMRGLYLVRE